MLDVVLTGDGFGVGGVGNVADGEYSHTNVGSPVKLYTVNITVSDDDIATVKFLYCLSLIYSLELSKSFIVTFLTCEYGNVTVMIPFFVDV